MAFLYGLCSGLLCAWPFWPIDEIPGLLSGYFDWRVSNSHMATLIHAFRVALMNKHS